MPWDDFGTALRDLRERVSPESLGVPPSLPRQRRVPGLRRDELAGLAGVSEEHIKRIEQGRRRPSTSVVDALATALRLRPDDHGQLRALAGFAAPAAPSGRVPQEITPAASRMLERLTDVPVCVCDAMWTVLAGNAHFIGNPCPGNDCGCNLAWMIFSEPPAHLCREPEYLAAVRVSMANGLRAAVRRYPTDPRLRALISDLRGLGEVFTEVWDGPSDLTEGPDRLHMPDGNGGKTVFDKDVLTLDPGDLRVIVFTRS